MKFKKNMQLIYGIALVFIILNLLLLQNYQINKIKKDYNSQIFSLKKDILKVQDELENKEKQIESLSSQITETNLQIKEANKQYELQIGNLNQKLSDLIVESESFSSIISEVIDSVVSVLTDTGQGSGVIISPEGYVITNYHVIESARKASIMNYNGDIYSVRLIGYDIINDIAVLKINSNNSFNYLEFGNSDLLKAGQKVIALGNPAGLSFTATEGIISSPSRLVNDGKYYIQTDVTLNPGNSGGPLIDSQGEIIGIINFKISGYEELGFAIPSNKVRKIVEEII